MPLPLPTQVEVTVLPDISKSRINSTHITDERSSTLSRQAAKAQHRSHRRSDRTRSQHAQNSNGRRSHTDMKHEPTQPETIQESHLEEDSRTLDSSM